MTSVRITAHRRIFSSYASLRLSRQHRTIVRKGYDCAMQISCSNRLTAVKAMSYGDLWSLWDRDAPGWLRAHLRDLRARYAVEI